jgi:hypothetical protein
MNKTDALPKAAARAVIRLAIADLASADMSLFESARVYFMSNQVKKDLESGDYPIELLDSITDVLQRSPIQRKVLSKQILRYLKAEFA